MAHRSPNCPQISFREAAEKGRKVYAKERQHPAAKEVVARDLGYSGLNGRSMSLLGALRQYGLLEGSGSALRVSDDAVAYFVRDDGPEKDEALRRMLYKPALFAEMYNQFGNLLPSDGNLKHILVAKGFSEESADDVIRVYKANSELVGVDNSEYNDPVEESVNTMPTATSPISQTPEAVQRVVGAPHLWRWPLSVPRGVDAQVTLTGHFTKTDIARLIKQLEFLSESFDDKDNEGAS